MADLTQLIDAYLDDAIDDAGRASLESILADDADAAMAFARRSLLHRLMIERQRVAQYQHQDARRTWTIMLKSMVQRHAVRWAAVLLFAAGITMWFHTHDVSPVAPSGGAAGPIVAMLLSSTDVQWDSALLMPGSDVSNQTLRIASGAIELQTTSGTTINLLGPAELKLVDPMRVELKSGRVHVNVPKPASGFTVVSGGWSVIDVGTVFGVSTRSEGGTDVYVYDGQVVMTSPKGAYQVVNAGQAVRTAGETSRMLALDEGGYARLLVDVATARATAPTATRKVALWLAADRGVEKDDAGRVTRWRDIGQGDGAVQAMQDDAAAAPVWTAQAINHRPAMHFDGRQCMELPTTQSMGLVDSDYEMFIVARTTLPQVQFLVSESADDVIERFEMHLNGSAGLRFIPNGARTSGGLADDPFPGYADMGHSGEYLGSPHIFSARVSGDVGSAAVDGVDGTDVVTSAARSRYEGPMRLGMRTRNQFPFSGDIAEVLIYRSALTPGQRAVVLAYLSRKYDIEIHRPNVAAGEKEPV
ncbi:MAG: hypothetical protein GC162_19490 [Planctomycetes bacterium]|nr:hypothetical protein [Planctomycetota bacterium]